VQHYCPKKSIKRPLASGMQLWRVAGCSGKSKRK